MIILLSCRIEIWPYGGSTYAISRAMFDAVGRSNWEKYMYQLQCSNADINVMNIIFNAGYSIHQFDHVFNPSFAPHHVHTIKQQFDTFASPRQPLDVLQAACSYPNITGLVGQSSFDRFCKNIDKSKE